MNISSKDIEKIKKCKNYRYSNGKRFCKLKEKRTYLIECKKCEHKSNMSIIDCYYKNQSCLECYSCDNSWNKHFEEGIVYCHKLNKRISVNSRCEHYSLNKEKTK